MSQIDEIALLLAEINGDSPCRRYSYLDGTADGPGGLHTESPSGGCPISPLPSTPPQHTKKSLKLRKVKQPVSVERNSKLSMPTFEGNSPDLCTPLSTQCSFPGPFCAKWSGEGVECSGRERDSKSDIDEQTAGDLEESIGGDWTFPPRASIKVRQ